MKQNLPISRSMRQPCPSLSRDESFFDLRVALVYDALYGAGPDTDHYRDIARSGPLDVLDVGCGSGRLSVLLAQDGHRVVGMDPSAAMLAQAYRRDRTRSASWVVGDARNMRLGRAFDLITMTGHAFQVLLDDSETVAFLIGAHDHLRPGGTLAFETRNPEVSAWTDWVPARSRQATWVHGLGRVELHHELVETSHELVTYRTNYRFEDGDELVTSSTLRFPTRTAVTAALRNAGFANVEAFGEWNRSAITSTSPELIFVAVRSAGPAPQ